MQSFDVLVIGGGPGGYVAAIKAAANGKRTAVVEKENLGGVCLNWGCIPTKSLLRNAEMIRGLSKGEEFGFSVSNIKADYAKAQQRSRGVSAKLVKGIEYLMKKNNVKVFSDTAAFLSNDTVKLKQSGEKIQAKNIIIATGSYPVRLPMLDYEKPNVLDSKKALELKKAPKSVIIIGAGAIGMEFGTVFASYGAKVHIIEMLPNVLPNEDAEVSAAVEKEYRSKGFDVHTGTKLITAENDGKTITATFEKNGKTFTLQSEYILTATGVRPNTKGIGLFAAGVQTNERGYIPSDKNMMTNVRGIYAIGDVNGQLTLAHVASAQGIKAADHICGKTSKEILPVFAPKCTYTSPEAASAGYTVSKAKEAGFDAAEAVFPFSANGKAISYGEDAGFVKLVYDKKDGQLLGAHMAGAHVTEMIWGIVGYLGLEMTMEEMASVVHPHPTMSEAIMEAAHLAQGHAIHI